MAQFLGTATKTNSLVIVVPGNSFSGSVIHANTADRIYTLPDKAGTFAMLSDISGGGLPTQTGNSGKVLSTDGSTASWTSSINPVTLTTTSAVPFLTSTRSDLVNSVSFTHTSANLVTSTAQLVLPSDPIANLQTATKQYVDNVAAAATSAAAIGQWTSYTPTWTAVTTNPTLGNGSIVGAYRRIGDSSEIEITISLGSTSTIGSGNYSISMPPGLTAKANAFPSTTTPLGSGGFNKGTTALYALYPIVDTTNNVIQMLSTGNVLFSETLLTGFTTGFVTLKLTVPINEWSTNVSLIRDFTEYAYNTSTSTATDTTSFGYGPDGVAIQAFAPSATGLVTKTVRFTQPIKQSDILVFEVLPQGTYSWIPMNQYWGPWYADATNYYGVQVNIQNSTDVNVNFFSKMNAQQTWSAATTASKWRLRKISNGNYAQGSPSYSEVVGNGALTTIDVTHNLGTTDCDVAIWELSGNKRKVDSGVEIRSISSTQIRLVFNTAPATNSLRVTVFSNGGNCATGDMYSPLGSTEISVTGATSAIIGKLHVCSGTSYTLTLPAAASNLGKSIGIRMASSLSGLVVIQGNASELIDGSNTRIMWANETATLYCDGTSWTKTAGRTIPMTGAMSLAANQIPANVTWTTILFDTEIGTGSPSGMVDLVNHRFNIKRPGRYSFTGNVRWNNTNIQAHTSDMRISASSGAALYTSDYVVASQPLSKTVTDATHICSLNDTITFDAYYSSGTFTTTAFAASANGTWFQAIEIPTW